jgi:hypothetical protein
MGMTDCVAQRFLSQLKRFSEHGIFHGITVYQGNKPLNIKYKKGLLIIEWE